MGVVLLGSPAAPPTVRRDSMATLRLLAGLVALPIVVGHGAVVYPPPKDAVDHAEQPWGGPVPKAPPGVESATS